MDFNHLKQEVNKLLAAIEADGKPIWFAGLIPAHFGLSNSPFVLQIGADWLKGDFATRRQGLHYIIDKTYQSMSSEARACIDRPSDFSTDSLHPMAPDAILRNNVGFDYEAYNREQLLKYEASF